MFQFEIRNNLLLIYDVAILLLSVSNFVVMKEFGFELCDEFFEFCIIYCADILIVFMWSFKGL